MSNPKTKPANSSQQQLGSPKGKGSPRLVVHGPPHGRAEAAFTTQKEVAVNHEPFLEQVSHLPGFNTNTEMVKMKRLKPKAKADIEKMLGNNNKRKLSTPSWKDKTTEFFKRGMGSTLNYGKSAFARKKSQPTAKEAVLYFFFILLFTIIVFMGRSDGPAYYFNSMVKQIFVEEEFLQTDSFIKKTFLDINTHEEAFQWLSDHFVSAIFPEEWYNGQPLTEVQRNYILGYYRRIGTVRLRQIRVKPNSCKLIKRYRDVIEECYGAYSDSEKETAPFGPDNMYTYTDGKKGIWYQGRFSYYDQGGYIVDLIPNKTIARQQILDLEENLWFDTHTRAVFVDMTLYNGNINHFCVARFVLEFPFTGGVVPYYTIRTIKLYRYETAEDWVLCVFELLFILYVLYYLFEEIGEMKERRTAYWKEFWNYVDITNILIFLTVATFRILSLILMQELDYDPKSDVEEYIDFQTVAFFVDQERNINAANAFLCWFKILKYIRISTRLSQLTDTLSNASIDILVFLGIFFIVFFGYSQAAWMIFGNDMMEFRSLVQSMFTLFRCILGDFNFFAMEQTNRYLGPAFFISFQVLVFFILINMFLAIINDSYIEIKNREENKKKFQISKYLSQSLDKLKQKLQRKKEKVQEIRNAFVDADENKDGFVDEGEIEKVLKEHSAAAIGLSAKEVLRQYDKDNNMALDEEEKQRFLQDLKQRELELSNMQRMVSQEKYSERDDYEKESEKANTVLGTKSVKVREVPPLTGSALHKKSRQAVARALNKFETNKLVVLDTSDPNVQESMPPPDDDEDTDTDEESLLNEMGELLHGRSQTDDSWIIEKRVVQRIDNLETSVKLILDNIMIINNKLDKIFTPPSTVRGPSKSPQPSTPSPPAGPKSLPVPALNLEKVYHSPRSLTIPTPTVNPLEAALEAVRKSDHDSAESLDDTSALTPPSFPIASVPAHPPLKVTLPPLNQSPLQKVMPPPFMKDRE